MSYAQEVINRANRALGINTEADKEKQAQFDKIKNRDGFDNLLNGPGYEFEKKAQRHPDSIGKGLKVSRVYYDFPLSSGKRPCITMEVDCTAESEKAWGGMDIGDNIQLDNFLQTLRGELKRMVPAKYKNIETWLMKKEDFGVTYVFVWLLVV